MAQRRQALVTLSIRTSLDEFPQFFNVLKEVLSLLFEPLVSKQTVWCIIMHGFRLNLALQVCGRSAGEVSRTSKRWCLDREYVVLECGMDIKILLEPLVVLKKDGSM